MPFSSGTTGLAKGVAVTQANMTASVQQLVATGMVNKENGSVVMGCLPLYHICQSPPHFLPSMCIH